MSITQSAYSTSEREQLILEHLPQVRWIASSIHERLPSSISVEDLVSTGILGLIHAVDNFDAAKNASLRTYAEFRIRGTILDSLRGLDGIPTHKRKRIRLVQAAISHLTQLHSREPAEEEIAAELGIDCSEYQIWLSELRGVSLGSLDSSGEEGSGIGLLEYIADPRQEDPGIRMERAELSAMLAVGIERMPEAERTVIDLYYHKELTLAEIARVMGVHLSRISQIKVQAVLRLRTYLRQRLKTPVQHISEE
ncbi:MAG: FliA/WhiG family RNA polymerase sigma factor [Bryobacteraceae bacterium]|nr:FliA/WhiG family RNA polymerase sigma factor [Bryobacteraceae bacterium]